MEKKHRKEMMEVVVNEVRSLNNLRNLQSLGKIVIHKEKVMLKWYYDLFYNDDFVYLQKEYNFSL